MPSAGFEPAIPAGERPQSHALDHAAPGISTVSFLQNRTLIGSNFSTGALSVLNRAKEKGCKGAPRRRRANGAAAPASWVEGGSKLGGKINTLNANNFSTLKALSY